MGKHAFWMASFQCLAKSLLPALPNFFSPIFGYLLQRT